MNQSSDSHRRFSQPTGRCGPAWISWQRVIALIAVIVATPSLAVMPLPACLAKEQGELVVRVSDAVIKAFCEEICPLTMSGTKRGGIKVLGQEVNQEIPWTVTVEDPRITITPKRQTFVAKAFAKSSAAPGVSWSDDISGDLDVSYDADRKAVIVRAADVIAKVAVGPLKLDVDVSDDIPEFVFPLNIPDIDMPNQRKSIAVAIDPEISFAEDAIVVTGVPTFRSRKAAGKKSGEEP
jgi:hypothetical protein